MSKNQQLTLSIISDITYVIKWFLIRGILIVASLQLLDNGCTKMKYMSDNIQQIQNTNQ